MCRLSARIMPIGAAYLLLGFLCLFFLVWWGGVAYVLAWPAASFLTVAAGYFGLGASVLGKGADGARPVWIGLLHTPYFSLMCVLRHLRRSVAPEPAWGEVSPGLYVGRLGPAHELPEDVGMVVDMAAELEEPQSSRDLGRYLCVPALDGDVPEPAEFHALVELMHEFEGTIYVHCAAGHGRSATAAAALLMRRGIVNDVEGALELMQRARPTVHLRRRQRRLIMRYASGRS